MKKFSFFQKIELFIINILIIKKELQTIKLKNQIEQYFADSKIL